MGMVKAFYDGLEGRAVGELWYYTVSKSATPTTQSATSRIEPMEREPTLELGVHETRILDVDYTEEQAQWKHGYSRRGTARSSELLHGGGDGGERCSVLVSGRETSR